MGKFNLLTTLSLNAAGMSEGLKSSIAEVEKFVEKTKAGNNSLNASFRDVAEMGVGEMRKEMMKLRNISFAGKSQQEIAAINGRIGELMDSMGDLKAQQKGLGMEFGTAMAKGMQVFAAAGETVFGVASMFGASKEKAQEYQQAMVSLIGVTQGLGVIQDAYETKLFTTLGIKIKDTAATIADTAAKYANAAASRVMGAAIVVNPMMLAVAAAAALVIGIVALTKAFEANRGAIDETNQSLSETITLQKQAQQASLDLAAKNQDTMNQLEKAAGKISDETYNKRKNALEKESALRAVEKNEKAALSNFDKALAEEQAKTYAMSAADYLKWETKKKEILQDFSSQKSEIIKAEYLQNNLVDEGTKKIKKQGEAVKELKDEWVAAYEKTQELAQFNVPQNIKGVTNDGSDMPGTKGKTDINVQVTNGFIQSLKDRHAAFVKYSEMQVSEAAKAAAKTLEIERALRDSKLSILGDAFGAAAGLFKQNTIAYQVMASAQAAMDTYRAANVALASFPPPFNFIAMGTSIAAGLANVMRINSIGGFASGGVVAGSSYSGDKVFARVNSAERILTASQNAAFESMVFGGGANGGELTARVSGSDLLFVLDRHSRKRKNTR